MQSYHCQQATIQSAHPSHQDDGSTLSTCHPLSNFLSYDRIFHSHKSFIFVISILIESQTYSQTVTIPKWKSIMQVEISALEENYTWDLVPLPVGKHPVGCK